ncbi:helix-turn-helix domain-containing protein [Actinomycetospora sp. TBRC 11914]|uniref:helix-turn-helix domain-containing protein n=1 Tax=Actinomycetospora sp. TBRC 11914 TaxID=2729387 RepID=UPI00145EB714|nr:helix-turn-helix domain-containing protein [Actinomycetospora sp. TBRC 11914]NMO90661.1 AraC family transcriptional regulator [Actinomycetospora sp. TBRC 11914]
MSEPSPAPGVSRDRFVTTDLAEAEHFLRRNYTDLSLQVADRQDFRFGHDTTAATDLAISRLSSSVAFTTHAAPLDHVVVVDVRAGAVTWTTRGHGAVPVAAGDIGLNPLATGYRTTVEPGDVDMVVLDPVRVADYAAHTCGIPAEDLVFTGQSPLSPRLARHWRATNAHVRRGVLGDPLLAGEPIVRDHAFRLLACALLAMFPNTGLEAVTDPHDGGAAGDVGEATLREVVDYLHHHAGDPTGPAEIAGIADAPYLDVTASLRRRRGTHPAELLWHARLLGAHRDLRDADPATVAEGDAARAVAAVAARWGFDRPRAFGVAYRMLTGGETPEHTLRR